MSEYCYYDLSPRKGAKHLSQTVALKRITAAFAIHKFSHKAAQKDAAIRLRALKKLGAPEKVLKSYREGKPVRCWIENDKGEVLEFDVWPNAGIIVTPIPNARPHACAALAKRLAKVLEYRCKEEYGV